MRRSSLVPFSLLLLTPLPLHSQQTAEAAIREGVRKYVEAFNAGDAEGAAATYALDGTHTYAFGVTHRGRAEIARGLKEQFAGPLQGTKLEIQTLDIRSLTADVALEQETFTLEGLRGPDGEPLPPVRGLCLAVYRRQEDGSWPAAAVQCFVPLTPPGNS